MENLGTYSRYTYEPRQQIFFDKAMVGDTAKVFIKTTFNTDLGPTQEIEKLESVSYNPQGVLPVVNVLEPFQIDSCAIQNLLN